jgi:aryl-alcohol dehydrogenase-like predicted oxidoreductase
VTVPTRPLGATGIDVGTIALGTMMFGSWGNEDVDECVRMVDLAIERGVTLFDTADIYDQGRSEEILGRALAGRRDRVVVATKCGNPMGDDPAMRGLSARWIRTACEDSLRRLGTDRIDLFQMHRPDPATPIEESVAAMDELVRAGKIRAWGTSTFSREQLEAARAAALAAGAAPPASEQPPYSALVRGVEREVLPWCAAHDVGVLVWAPLNGGWLTGKYRSGALDPEGRAVKKAEHFDHRDEAVRAEKHELVERLAGVADAAGLTLVQLALGFVTAHPAVTAAIVGPRRLDQLPALLDAAGVQLAPEVLAAIDEIVPHGRTVNPANDG